MTATHGAAPHYPEAGVPVVGVASGCTVIRSARTVAPPTYNSLPSGSFTVALYVPAQEAPSGASVASTLSVTTARSVPSPSVTSPTQVSAAVAGPVVCQAPWAALLKMTGNPPAAGETGRPEKRTVPSAMTVSRLCEGPVGVSKVRRQAPTTRGASPDGVPDWAPARRCVRPAAVVATASKPPATNGTRRMTSSQRGDAGECWWNSPQNTSNPSQDRRREIRANRGCI